MTVTSPPRASAPRAVSRQLVEESPLRYPDTRSREFMTRRGWWLVRTRDGARGWVPDDAVAPVPRLD